MLYLKLEGPQCRMTNTIEPGKTALKNATPPPPNRKYQTNPFPHPTQTKSAGCRLPNRPIQEPDSRACRRAATTRHASMVFPTTTLIKAVKGTRDLLHPSTEVWNRVEAVARSVFRAYNYHEIRTPILEETQLFARGVGADTDIVTKEMYTFDDHGTSLTLRPENTASVIRAYIEHRLDQRPGVQKLYYLGPMFRRERPQKGRYRQFFQIGAEAIGSESPLVDAEVIEMVIEILQGAGLSGFKLLLNSVGDHNCRPL